MGKRSALRDRAEAAVCGAFLSLVERMPRRMAEAAGYAGARIMDAAVPRLRRTADANLRMAFPERDAEWRSRTIDGVFRSVGRLLAAFAQFPRIDKSNVADWIRYEGFEHYVDARQRGAGVLFATAHLGNWELSAFAHALLAEPMNIVVRPLDNPRIDALVGSRRALSGNRLLSKRDFARSILQALRRNEPVGILVDQNASPENGVFVPFFGTPACANLTFAKLAWRSGAAVIPGFAIWNDSERRYILRFHPEIPMTGNAAEDTRRVQAAVEAGIREAPDQWLWIHRRWKTRPEGEQPLYR